MAPDREAGGLVSASRAFKSYLSPFIIIIVEGKVIIALIVDLEILFVVVGNDHVVVIIVSAVLGEASRHLAGCGRFFLVLGILDDHVIVLADEFLGFFLVVLFVLDLFDLGAFIVVVPDDGVVLFVGIVIILGHGLHGGAGGFRLHLGDGGADHFVFRIKFSAAFGANCRALVEIVEPRLAG